MSLMVAQDPSCVTQKPWIHAHLLEKDLFVPAPLKAPDPNAKLTNLREVLAFNVRTLRVGGRLSQEQLGFAAGVDRTFISQVERAKINISLDNIERLATTLAVEPFQLIRRPS